MAGDFPLLRDHGRLPAQRAVQKLQIPAGNRVSRDRRVGEPAGGRRASLHRTV